jgi:ABC-type tungstate transport system substrate-binding protein
MVNYTDKCPEGSLGGIGLVFTIFILLIGCSILIFHLLDGDEFVTVAFSDGSKRETQDWLAAWLELKTQKMIVHFNWCLGDKLRVNSVWIIKAKMY